MRGKKKLITTIIQSYQIDTSMSAFSHQLNQPHQLVERCLYRRKLFFVFIFSLNKTRKKSHTSQSSFIKSYSSFDAICHHFFVHQVCCSLMSDNCTTTTTIMNRVQSIEMCPQHIECE